MKIKMMLVGFLVLIGVSAFASGDGSHGSGKHKKLNEQKVKLTLQLLLFILLSSGFGAAAFAQNPVFDSRDQICVFHSAEQMRMAAIMAKAAKTCTSTSEKVDSAAQAKACKKLKWAANTYYVKGRWVVTHCAE